MGLVRPSDLGVRGALVATIMPPDQLVGAISISRTTMDTARIAGALSGAGLFASLGMGPAYVAIVGLYVAGTAADALRSPRRNRGTSRGGERGAAELAAARSEGRRGLCMDHATHAGRALDRLPGQSDRLSADQRASALRCAGDLSAPPRPASDICRRALRSARWSVRSP